MVSQKTFIQQGKGYLANRFNYPAIDVRQGLTAHPDPDNKYKNCVFMIFRNNNKQCNCVMFTPFDLSDVGMREIPDPLEFDWQNARDCLNEYLIENNLEDKGLESAFHQLDLIAFDKKQATVRFHLNISEETYLPPNKEKEAILADITNQKHLDKLAIEIPCNTNLDWPDRDELIACLNQVLHINNYKNLKEWIEKNPDKCGRPENVIPYQLNKLNGLVQQADKKYDLSNVEGLYDFSHELYRDYRAEIEFNEGLPIELCVSTEINEPINNWKISQFMDLQHINFNDSLEIEDFCSEIYDLEEASPKDFNISNKNPAPQHDVVKNAQVAGKVAGKKINKKR